jgi:hypothetical protein
MRATLLAIGLLFITNAGGRESAPVPVPCKTIADCWLDNEGHPIARPKSKRGLKIPRGNCDTRLVWLRYQLSCTEQVCTALFLPDQC